MEKCNKEIIKERFNRVATYRTIKVVESIISLSNCSERKNYKYNKKQVKKLFSLIRNATRHAELKFGYGVDLSKTKLEKQLSSLYEKV